jgi:exopolysaccharide biosynthesis protein
MVNEMIKTKRKKYRLKKGAMFFLVFLLVVALTGIGYKSFGYFFYVQVEVSNIPKPKAPVTSTTLTNKNAKKIAVISDDWNYIDGNISIKIQKTQKNSGKGLVTMFIADVTLNDINYLHTAFAKNEFGLHITQQVSQMAHNNNALFAVNGDYYGYRDNGIIVRNGVLYRDNPARDMLALFKSGSMSIVDEKNANVKNLMLNGLLDSFSFGPALIKDGKITSKFSSVFRDHWFIQNVEPRTGIGFISPKHFIFIVVDGRKDYYSRGLTMAEFANEFLNLGCTEAYNLDGGGSSTMYFRGRIVNNPLGRNGNYERYVSDIIYINNPISNQDTPTNSSQQAK